MADHACPDCGAVHREKPTSLKQRVEMLEHRLAMLEARAPQWSWTTTPSFYTDASDQTTVSRPDPTVTD